MTIPFCRGGKFLAGGRRSCSPGSWRRGRCFSGRCQEDFAGQKPLTVMPENKCTSTSAPTEMRLNMIMRKTVRLQQEMNGRKKSPAFGAPDMLLFIEKNTRSFCALGGNLPAVDPVLAQLVSGHFFL